MNIVYDNLNGDFINDFSYNADEIDIFVAINGKDLFSSNVNDKCVYIIIVITILFLCFNLYFDALLHSIINSSAIRREKWDEAHVIIHSSKNNNVSIIKGISSFVISFDCDQTK